MDDKKLLAVALLELAKQNVNELKRIEKRLADISHYALIISTRLAAKD